MDGKAFKASIGLVGLAGRFGLEMEGVERSEDSTDLDSKSEYKASFFFVLENY